MTKSELMLLRMLIATHSTTAGLSAERRERLEAIIAWMRTVLPTVHVSTLCAVWFELLAAPTAGCLLAEDAAVTIVQPGPYMTVSTVDWYVRCCAPGCVPGPLVMEPVLACTFRPNGPCVLIPKRAEVRDAQ